MTIARGALLLALAAVLVGGCRQKADDPGQHHHHDHDPEATAQPDDTDGSAAEVVVTDAPPAVADEAKSGPELLADWMCGRFSSEWQYDNNPEVYFNLRSYVTRIWPDRTGGPWLYAETGVHIEHLDADAPFSQRIYQLVPTASGEISIRHFEFMEEYDDVRVAMLGAWRFENPLAEVTLDQLKERDTCTVYVTRTDEDLFAGRTRDKECIPNNDYVDYAVFERWYMKNEMRAWDRGFSDGDIHLVGPVDGPYIFEKTASGPIQIEHAATDILDAEMLRKLPPATQPSDD